MTHLQPIGMDQSKSYRYDCYSLVKSSIEVTEQSYDNASSNEKTERVMKPKFMHQTHVHQSKGYFNFFIKLHINVCLSQNITIIVLQSILCQIM